MNTFLSRKLLFLVLSSLLLTQLSACFPLVAGAALVGGVVVASDRRSVGAQAEDQALEMKVSQSIGSKISKAAHINVTSYNRIVLLTGEVPSTAEQSQLVALANLVPNIREVHNEVIVGPASSLGQRSQDTVLTTKVKSGLIDQRGIKADTIKVVSEQGIVYLMGLVTTEEANIAQQRTATVPGVIRVVSLLEIISKEELLRLQPPPPPPPPSLPPTKFNIGDKDYNQQSQSN